MTGKEVKSRIGTKVKYDGDKYMFTGYILRRNKDGNLFAQAEITSLKSNSVVICKIGEIE